MVIAGRDVLPFTGRMSRERKIFSFKIVNKDAIFLRINNPVFCQAINSVSGNQSRSHQSGAPLHPWSNGIEILLCQCWRHNNASSSVLVIKI